MGNIKWYTHVVQHIICAPEQAQLLCHFVTSNVYPAFQDIILSLYFVEKNSNIGLGRSGLNFTVRIMLCKKRIYGQPG